MRDNRLQTHKRENPTQRADGEENQGNTDLPLEPLLESQNGSVNGILKLNIIVVALLQKGLGIDLKLFAP